jgi:hypothetical protein
MTKYLAEKHANVVHKKTVLKCRLLIRIVTKVARVMDLGSGQLNISGFELLRKDIEGNDK